MEKILLISLIFTILVIGNWLYLRRGSRNRLSSGSAQLRMHEGVLLPSNLPCYFLTVCNFSGIPITVTHLWMETANPASGPPRQVQMIFPGWGPILPSDVREACVPKELFPVIEDWFLCGRIRLSDGQVLKSTLDLNVPPMGLILGNTSSMTYVTSGPKPATLRLVDDNGRCLELDPKTLPPGDNMSPITPITHIPSKTVD
jgi:hypothetical protein